MGLSPSLSPRSIPFNIPETVSNLELALCLMVGTASLPHILIRSAATARTEQARTQAAWSLLFIALLVFTLPTFFAIAADETAGSWSGVSGGLVIVIELTAMLAAASGVTLTLANSLAHDICGNAAADVRPAARLLLARGALAAVLALATYGAATLPPEPLNFVAWSFSLAAAGYFPALVLGIWWQRTTTAAAVCGMIAGFGVALFYLVVSRYFPQAGVLHFGMSSLVDPSGQPLVNVTQVLGDPRWLADAPASVANPLASKVGWFNVSTLACGVFGVPVGFFTIVALSLIGRRSLPERQSAIETVRTPANARTHSY
jgi:Na+(H+)/acetate symporter ActP